MAGEHTAAARFKFAPRILAVAAVAIYRAAISPILHAINGPACRFEPSCSAYAHDALAEHGIIRGGLMALWRVARCNPLGGHGYDPVREAKAKASSSPLPARERTKVRVLIQRAFSRATQDSASALNLRQKSQTTRN